MRWKIAGALLAGVSLAAGCGTIGAIGRAESSLAEAKQAGAEQKAPYEYAKADLLLALAIEEKDEMDLKAAHAWALESADYAAKALEKAKGGGQ